jgi:hypothetical protein
MTYLLTMAVAVFFCGLYTGAYFWMRRPGFGEPARRKKTVSDPEESERHVLGQPR